MDHNNLEILGLCMMDGEDIIYQVMDFDDSDGTQEVERKKMGSHDHGFPLLL